MTPTPAGEVAPPAGPVATPAAVPRSGASLLIAGWGVFGVLILLGQALWRLTPLALEPLLAGTMNGFQLALYFGWVAFNAYAEGYRGFQKGFAPRVVVRAFHLADHPRPLHVLLAPAFCMSLLHATRRGLIVAWCMLSGIVVVVILVRRLPQPWRGIIDAGVIIGLAWGVVAILVFFARAARGVLPEARANLPE